MTNQFDYLIPRVLEDRDLASALRGLDESRPDYNRGVLRAIGLERYADEIAAADYALRTAREELERALEAHPSAPSEDELEQFMGGREDDEVKAARERCWLAHCQCSRAWAPMGKLIEIGNINYDGGIC